MDWWLGESFAVYIVSNHNSFQHHCSKTAIAVCRQQQATGWALDSLASSRELAQWGDQLHRKLRRWQRAFTGAMIALTLTVSAFGYQTAVHHSGECMNYWHCLTPSHNLQGRTWLSYAY